MKWADTAISFNPTTIVNQLQGINASESGNIVKFLKSNLEGILMKQHCIKHLPKIYGWECEKCPNFDIKFL